MQHATNRRQRATARAIPFPAREVVILTFLMALAAMLTGCNTVEGAGQDLQSGGRAIERTAE
ncbi:entericidin A/B family lipoprotein [Azospirillum sp. CT11-132]|jgi:predicted small secreted protein|uniref:entericidin A/B family lipoprotein n=1 Tax=unclassified Azospirillum TaxID=2630922 RepID=UPI000D60CDC3|nr:MULTISPECIES: entericidin A/B family lipoprotein [unclassified Azospirillum]MCM8733562.1 entericidin A/B family lipoprotein [Azospirillum sp. A1-3]PWC54861.1 entericidin EcnAB [Azospirillum sp. TSH7]PWC68277.1 entericidin EcnAB [Azospirillum sp. TSH20]